MSIFVMSLNRF